MDVAKEIIVIKGEVLGIEDQQYSSTHLSGGEVTAVGTGSNVQTISSPIQSSVEHHQNQKLWIKKEDGQEAAYSFYNSNIDAREGNTVVIYLSRKNGKIYRFRNLTTGYCWTINGWNISKNPFKRLALNFIQNIYALFRSAWLALPIISFFTAISYIFTINRKIDFNLVAKKIRLLRFTFIFLALINVILSYEYLMQKGHINIPTIDFTISKELQAKKIDWSDKTQSYIFDKTGIDIFGTQKLKKATIKAESIIESMNIRDKNIIILDKSQEHIQNFLFYTHLLLFFICYRLIRKEQKILNAINRYLSDLCTIKA